MESLDDTRCAIFDTGFIPGWKDALLIENVIKYHHMHPLSGFIGVESMLLCLAAAVIKENIFLWHNTSIVISIC